MTRAGITRPIPHKLRNLGGVNTKPHVVYIYRDNDGAPLYVGVTASVNFTARDSAHRCKAHWYSEAASVVIESEHPTRATGRLREAELIRDLRPAYNRHRGHIARWQALVALEQSA